MSDATGPDGPTSPAVDIQDPDAAARGAVYGLLRALFDEPADELGDALRSGEVGEELASLVDRTALDVTVPVDSLRAADGEKLLRARFNDIFAIGVPEPPVPLYESEYRDESWHELNVDLARAYDYFGLSVDQTNREHHDHLGLELEFAGYLARLAALSPESGAAQARRDFLDRHLAVFVRKLGDAVDAEAGVGVYGPLTGFLVAFVEADLADLDDRLAAEDAEPPAEEVKPP